MATEAETPGRRIGGQDSYAQVAAQQHPAHQQWQARQEQQIKQHLQQQQLKDQIPAQSDQAWQQLHPQQQSQQPQRHVPISQQQPTHVPSQQLPHRYIEGQEKSEQDKSTQQAWKPSQQTSARDVDDKSKDQSYQPQIFRHQLRDDQNLKSHDDKSKQRDDIWSKNRDDIQSSKQQRDTSPWQEQSRDDADSDTQQQQPQQQPRHRKQQAQERNQSPTADINKDVNIQQRGDQESAQGRNTSLLSWPRDVLDILYYRDPVLSIATFSGIVAFYFMFVFDTGFSMLFLLSFTLKWILLPLFAVNGLMYLRSVYMQNGARFNSPVDTLIIPALRRNANFIKRYLPTREQILGDIDTSLQRLPTLGNYFYRLATCESFLNTFKAIVALHALQMLGSYFDLGTISFLGVIAAFTIPVFYRGNQQSVDNIVHQVSDKVRAVGDSIPVPAALKQKSQEGVERPQDTAEEGMEKLKHKAQEVGETVRHKVQEYTDKASQKVHELTDRTKEKTQELSDKAKEKTQEVSDKTKEKAQEVSDKTKEKAQEVSDKTKEKTQDMPEKTTLKTQEVPEKTTLKTQEVPSQKTQDISDKAKEKVSEFGQKMAETGRDISDRAEASRISSAQTSQTAQASGTVEKKSQ